MPRDDHGHVLAQEVNAVAVNRAAEEGRLQVKQNVTIDIWQTLQIPFSATDPTILIAVVISEMGPVFNNYIKRRHYR